MTAGDVDDSMGTERNGGDGTRDVEAALRRALGTPTTPAELAGWDAVAAAYRESAGRPRRLRLVAGLPLSAAVAASVLVPAGAVAAAYTGRLPAHVQHWAHRALAPIGVPAHRGTPAESARHPVATPSPSPYRHLEHRTPMAVLPEPQHTTAVQLCRVLSRTPLEHQQPVLSALRRLLPREHDLQRTCRTLLVTRQAPHHASPSPHPSTSASPRASASASPTPSPRPTPTPSR